MDTATPMDETELIELEDEIAGESEHALKEDDFTFDISEEDLAVYKASFDVFDADGSGKINFTELESLIKNISERKPHEFETQELLQMLDADADGLVDLKEFIKAMAEKTEVQNKTVQYSMERLDTEETGEELMQGMTRRIELGVMDVDFDIEEEDLKAFNKAFREFDKDSSGKMNYTEVGNFMKFLRDEDIDETELQEVFDSMDSDDSGLVEFTEFVKVMVQKDDGDNSIVKHSLARYKTETPEDIEIQEIEKEMEQDIQMSKIMAYKVEDFDFYLKEEDLEHFKTSFDIFDQDDSGKISYTEMDGFIRSLTDKEPNEEETLLFLDMLDKDDSGMIEFPEFVRVMAKRAEAEEIKKKTQEFRDALKVFDFNGDGKVSAAELGDILTKQGRNKMSEEEVEEMINSVDKDDDGMVDFDEFIKLFTGVGSIKEFITGKPDEVLQEE